MRRMLIVCLVAAAAAVAACSGSSNPITPAAAPPPACQANNTGNVTFANHETTLTLDVVWDGAKLTTIAPSATSTTYTYAAGVPHTLTFLFTNTNVVACSTGTPVLTQCGSVTYFCPA